GCRASRSAHWRRDAQRAQRPQRLDYRRPRGKRPSDAPGHARPRSRQAEGPGMSNRRKIKMSATAMTALLDQEHAASGQMRRNAMRTLGRTEPDGTLRKGTPLDVKIDAAMTTAWASGRVCPHVVAGPRPSTLDVWRAIITCGECFLAEQFEPLPGNREFE